MIWRAQNSFSGGIISRKMYGRIDLGQYGSSLADLMNFKVLPHGGLLNRSGSKMCSKTKYPDKFSRNIPFEFSQSESYALEVGDKYIRFYQFGKLLLNGTTPVEIVTEYTVDDIKDLDYVQTGNHMFLLHPTYPPKKLIRSDSTGLNWTLENVAFIDGPYDLINTDKALTITSSSSTGTVSLSSTQPLFVSTDIGRLIRIFDATASPQSWGWGEITAFNDTMHVSAKVIERTFPTTATSLWKLGKYSKTTGYPSTGTFYERRLCLSGMKEFPQDIDMSRTDFPEEFFTNAELNVVANDSVSVGLYSEHIDEIQWLRQTRSGLAVGTSGGEWVVTGVGGKDDPIRPDSVLARQTVVTPCHSFVKPRQLDYSILFLGKAGERIHELAFDWKEDALVALDLTLLAEDLFAGKEVTCLESSLTDRILWAVLNDGTLLGLTYMKNESIVAWHKHSTLGRYESIASISEHGKETLYATVVRTISGVEQRFVEVFEHDFDGVDIKEAFFVDCGVTQRHSGEFTVVSGLDHLEGEYVVALADGRTVAPMRVVSGNIYLPFKAKIAHVGLPITSYGVTLPVELDGLRSGSSLGRMKEIASVILLVTSSYGCKIGRDLDSLEEVIFNEELVFGVHPELFSGSKKVESIGGQPSREVQVAFAQDVPLPLTLNSMITEMTVLED
jgi:hypothetical protein